MDNSNYTPSELIDLALDCELDTSQATSLFELLSRDSSLQEEFRQAVAIRRALSNDVLASIPTLEFTKSLFQRAGVEMPSDVTPSFFARTGLKWASLATTAFVFLGIGIIATMNIDGFYERQAAESYSPIQLPKLYSIEAASKKEPATYNDNQILNYSENTLSPFHTPTYHHNQKASKGTTDGITIMSENDRAELSVGLSSDANAAESQKTQNLLPTTSVLLENSFLKNIGMNFLNIEKKNIVAVSSIGRILLPALDYSSIRGNAALAMPESIKAELPPIEGTENLMIRDSKYALEFDGTNDHIIIDNIPKSIGENSTTTAWIYKTSEAVNQQEIVGMGARQNLVVQKDGRVAINNYLAKGRSDRNLDPGYWCAVADTEKIQLNKWVHYAGVVETDSKKTTMKLYRDGKLVNQKTFDYAVSGNPRCDGFIGGVHIGFKSPECWFTYSQCFVGQLDEISIWNRSLTQHEISDIMRRKLNHNEEGLIGYWPFEEGVGALSKDRSKYSNDASLLNGARWVKLQ